MCTHAEVCTPKAVESTIPSTMITVAKTSTRVSLRRIDANQSNNSWKPVGTRTNGSRKSHRSPSTYGARTWFRTTETPVSGMIRDCPASAKDSIAKGIGAIANSRNPTSHSLSTQAITQRSI